MPPLLPNPWALGIEIHFHEPHTLFAPLGIDNLVLGEWLVMAVLIVVALLLNRRITKVPNTRLQAAMEALLNFLEGWLAGFVGSRKEARKYMPLLATLFLFILLSNYSGLLPTAGQSWSFFPPTGKWGTTAGLGLVVMVAVQVISIRELGVLGWLAYITEAHYGWMSVLMAPLRILEEFVRPFSLSLRLFGNIFAEEVLLLIVSTLAPYLAPVPIMGLSLLFGLIQAIVFTTLTAIYIGGVVEAKAHHHGHEHSQGHGARGEPAHAHGEPVPAHGH